MVFPVLLGSYRLLRVCSCFSFNSLCGKIVNWDFSSNQHDRQQCHCRDLLLYRLCIVLPRVLGEHVGHPACLPVLPGQWERSGDEAGGGTQRSESGILTHYMSTACILCIA
uniref:Secreted protein n=1 Tax=Arundo donax TaxID=35708 RepID=A0A0A9D830_ARUDO